MALLALDKYRVTTPNSIVSPRAAWGLLLLVILLWGVNWPVMKYGLQYIGPLTFVAARMVMGAAVMFLVAAVRGELRWPDRRDWPVVLSVGLIQMAGFMILITLALQFVPAGRSAILAYTTSLWVIPIAVLVLGERLDRLKTVGFVLGLAGVAVMFNPFGFDWTDQRVLIGNGLLLLAALLWAVLIVQIRGHRWHGSPLSLGPWQFAVGALLAVPLAVWSEGWLAIRWSPATAAVLIYNGPLATAFCFWAMVSVNRALPAITTSLGTLGVPAVGVASALLGLGEQLTWTNGLGLLLIVGGLACVSLADRPRSPATAPAAPKPKV